MSCETCGHTMQSLGGGGDDVWHWCPRCGTLGRRSLIGSGGGQEAPRLVESCRQFEKDVFSDRVFNVGRLWKDAGLAESINKPEDRP